MKKVLVIIKREYLTRVRTKAFLIGTIITPLLMLALVLVPGFLASRGGGTRHVTILDQSGDPDLYRAIQKRLAPSETDAEEKNDGMSRSTNYTLSYKSVPPGEDLQATQKEYNDLVQKDTDQSYVILPPGILERNEPAQYFAKSTGDFSVQNVERAISSAVVERRLVRAGVNSDQITGYMESVEMQRNKVGPDGTTQEGGEALFLVGFVMLFFIYITVLMYGMAVMRGVMEEKQTRIVEVIISSVKPTQMMLGKLIGIGLVGLTQYLVWVGAALLLTLGGASLFGSSGFSFPKLPISLLIYFIIYFVLGYFLFATLYAMVGSTVSSDEDAQQAQFPITMLLVVPMILFGVVLSNPNSPMAVTLSMIPFFTPTLMMLRIAIINPPLWQILLSMLLMVVTILGVVWLAARIYRVGILMYGKRPNIAELGRWLRYS